MDIDYNPQLGYRRTIFTDNYDFLIKPCSVKEEEDGITFQVDTFRGKKAFVKVNFVTDSMFRFRMYPEAEGMKGNPIFYPKQGKAAVFQEKEDRYVYETEKLQLQFQKEYWEMSVYQDGKKLTTEQAFDTNVDNRWKYLPTGYHMDNNGRWKRAHATMYLYSDEAFWGFGEKFTEFNKRGQLLHCWQKDALSTNTEDSYKAHPFFVSSRGYAVLLNTFTRCRFDMGHTSQVSYQIEAEDGGLDYLFWAEADRNYKSLLQQYVAMTGQIPMIPKWAFGFWMSKCSYQCRQEIEEVVLRAEKEGFPIDVIHIDNWQKQENSGTWEWDEERFPDPAGMIAWLKQHQVRLSLWMYPYLVETSPRFKELEEKGYFVKDQNGQTAKFYATADSKDQAACFDFTNPEFLAWYKERVMYVLRMGVGVIKTDFSEAVPETAVYFDGSSGIEGHNKLTYLYAETIYQWMLEVKKETGELPMLWGRSGYAGSHRIPAAWAGDSSSALNNHASILRGGLSLAMSGVAFWGFDLGGFYNTAPNGNECPPSMEEYLRSVELGCFMPLARAHGKTPREPWNFSEKVLNISRKYNKIRHQLQPYLYSSACESHLEGIPMMRPLLLEYPHDVMACQQELEYLLGSSLLVAPPFDRDVYEIYLPAGMWCEYFTGEIFEGGRFLTVQPDLEQLPVYQKENTVIVEKVSDGEINAEEAEYRLRVFFTKEFRTVFYDMDADGCIREYPIHVYESEKDRCLYIETERKIQKVEVLSQKEYTDVFVNDI